MAVTEAGRPDRDDVAEVIDSDAEVARLVEAWDGAELAGVVDAVRTGAPPGTVRRFDANEFCAEAVASSHGLGAVDALALGRVPGRLPARLEVVSIEGSQFALGPELSPEVAAAVEPASSSPASWPKQLLRPRSGARAKPARRLRLAALPSGFSQGGGGMDHSDEVQF